MLVDVANRIITLHGEITQENTSELIHNLWIMDCEDNTDIELLINSEGGQAEGALAVGSTIRSLHSKVNTHAFGSCMSAAPWILAAGTGQRTATKTCAFMTHFGHWEIGDKGKDQLDAWLVYRDFITKIWYDSIAEWTGNSPKYWENLSLDKDHYFSAAEAKAYKLIDEVTE